MEGGHPMKPTRRYIIELLPYLAGNPQTGFELIDPKKTLSVDGTDIYVSAGQFYIKDVHGACVFSAPVESVRYCNIEVNKRVKKRLKVLSNIGDILK
jgi:hypothetical protein